MINQTVLLSPGYNTPAAQLGACYEFTHTFGTPVTGNIVAVVNEGLVFKETNYTNNRSNLHYEAFTITAAPAEVSVPRQTAVALHTTTAGGVAAKYMGAAYRAFLRRLP